MYRTSELNRCRGHYPNGRKCPTQVKADADGWLKISNQIAPIFYVNIRAKAVYSWSPLWVDSFHRSDRSSSCADGEIADKAEFSILIYLAFLLAQPLLR